ncbi:MAG: beta-N-acetylhexosaminidase [Sneathiella sp.]|nr:beta-N-acetylhexosaminidase [Sneathiella sp.]
MQRTDLEGVKPIIFSVEGLALSAEEKAFFASEKPFGLILFARNVSDPDQLKTLIADFRHAVGRRDAPVLVDQEGGRVQRLRPPHWFQAPALAKFGQLFDIDPKIGERAAILATDIISDDLTRVGFNVNCSPCLDLPRPETSNVIGDRALHKDIKILSRLGAVIADRYIERGIIPVMKHLPGHGRGTVDSHHELPTVSATRAELQESDFAPFKALNALPWAMTAHIVFDQIDLNAPATQSKTVIQDIIREDIGFKGLLLSDDLNMNALKGTLGERAEAAYTAGIDILLHCSGHMEEMCDIAPRISHMSEAVKDRVMASGAVMPTEGEVVAPFDRESAIQELEELLSLIS